MAGFVLTSASCSPFAIAELLVAYTFTCGRRLLTKTYPVIIDVVCIDVCLYNTDYSVIGFYRPPSFGTDQCSICWGWVEGV